MSKFKWLIQDPGHVKVKKKSQVKVSRPVKKDTKKKSFNRDAFIQSIKKGVRLKSDSREFAWGGELDASGKKRWIAVRQGVLHRDVKTRQLVKKNVVVPKGHEIVTDDRGPEWTWSSKVQKAPKGVSGAIEATEGVVKEWENVGPGGAHWRGFYSGKKFLNEGEVDIDHLVSVSRARKSGKFKKKEQKQEFYANMKNLVVAGSVLNREQKKGHGLAKWQPEQKERREAYAEAYHDVFKHYGMVMTHPERETYKKITGNEPEVASQHVLDWKRGEEIRKSQSRYDNPLMRVRPKK